MIPGVDGCVGDNDPCFMGFAANDIQVIANSEFLEENPSAAKLFEVINLSLGDVLAQNNRMAAGENSQEDIDKHAREWEKESSKEGRREIRKKNTEGT